MKKMPFYKPYMGYVREAFTYLSFPFLPKYEPAEKFVIFTVGRSGSTLLVSLLQSHEQIHCDDELFKRKLFSPLRYLRYKSRLSPKSVYGFKLNTYHFRVQQTEHPEDFLREIVNAGYQIISLQRKDLVRQAISHMYALERDKFHHNISQGNLDYEVFTVDLNALKSELELFESYKLQHEKLIAHFDCLQLYYEDDLLDETSHQRTVDRVADFLGVSSAPVRTNLVKTTPPKISDFVTNYDDVAEFLRSTVYASSLSSD
jgi:LPS sulfotransferase NodH